jgi:hypothetical protein
MLASGTPATPEPSADLDDSEADAAEGTVTVSDELEFADALAATNGHHDVDDPDAAVVTP